MESANIAVGGPAAVSAADGFAKDAAVRILRKGGSAVDGLVAAAAVQCVVANGATTLAGVWISNSFDPKTGVTTNVTSKIGPGKDEPYDYDMAGLEAWGGRGMPVPGWVSGAYQAWRNGGRLKWAELFEDAIGLAEGYPCDQATFTRIRPGLSMPMGARTEEGRATWMRDGRYLEMGDMVRQPALARTLKQIAEGGPDAFYEGEFARDYVAASRGLGGRLTPDDLAAGKDRAIVREVTPIGDYLGRKIVHATVHPEGGLVLYALHLAQAAELQSRSEAEAVYAQVRILEEAFHSTKQYSEETASEFIDPAYARSRIDDVLSSKPRPVSFELFWANTEVVAVRDQDGALAWLVHSINTSGMFGAGIVVGGAYAVKVLSRGHAVTGDLLTPGIGANPALYRDGKPEAVACSPGFGILHAPFFFHTGLFQRGRTPDEAIRAPRFGVASPMSAGAMPVESHYPRAVLDLLDQRGVPHLVCGASLLTGRVSAIAQHNSQIHAVQDVRSEGSGVAAFSRRGG